jgi:hypothetical protein
MTSAIFHLANNSAEGIIWLVIIVLWGIGQMLSAIKSAQKRNGQPPRPDGSPGQSPRRPESAGPAPKMPDSLPDFLESIFGSPKTEAPPPAVSPRPVMQSAPPKPKPTVGARQAEELRKTNVRRDAEQADAFAIRPSKSYSGMRSFKLPSIKLPATGTPLRRSRVASSPRISFDLRNNDNFKRAVLLKEIIGPPKSLHDDPFLSGG